MPAKKRKAGASTKSSAPEKKARFGDVSIIPDAEEPSLSSTGRPKRASVGEPRYDLTRRRSTSDPKTTPTSAAAEKTTPKKRGRPAKVTSTKPDPPSALSVVVPKKRGRPAKHAVAVTPKSNSGKTPVQFAKKTVNGTKSTNSPSKGATGKQPKSGPKSKAAVFKATSVVADHKQDAEPDSDSGPPKDLDPESGAQSDANPVNPGEMEGVDQDIQYWLMKAEPESRIEKGHDVKFSIDDLASKAEPEGWDGVRNPVARNQMRAMRVGDLAFFYHSNCKTPGVAGVMRIVAEHEVDQSAFDPNHPYYDPKSDREKPKWELVRVEFVKKFNSLITLKELRSYSLPGSVLQDMVMLKQSRLSVSPVTPAQWKFILGRAGEKPSLGHPAPRDGYETDKDGEGEAVVDETHEVDGDEIRDDELSGVNGHVPDEDENRDDTSQLGAEADTEDEEYPVDNDGVAASEE